MKIFTLRMATMILFMLIPILILLYMFYYAPYLKYGHGDITVNSIFLLLFAVYAFFVSLAHFRRCHDYWNNGNGRWKMQLTFTYFLIFIVALLLPFFMSCEDLILWIGHKYVNEYDLLSSIFKCLSYFSQDYVGALLFVSPAFVFPIGIALFCLSCAEFAHHKGRAKSYLIVIFLTSLIFALIGAVPALYVLVWWLKGGINPW